MGHVKYINARLYFLGFNCNTEIVVLFKVTIGFRFVIIFENKW